MSGWKPSSLPAGLGKIKKVINRLTTTPTTTTTTTSEDTDQQQQPSASGSTLAAPLGKSHTHTQTSCTNLISKQLTIDIAVDDATHVHGPTEDRFDHHSNDLPGHLIKTTDPRRHPKAHNKRIVNIIRPHGQDTPSPVNVDSTRVKVDHLTQQDRDDDVTMDSDTQSTEPVDPHPQPQPQPSPEQMDIDVVTREPSPTLDATQPLEQQTTTQPSQMATQPLFMDQSDDDDDQHVQLDSNMVTSSNTAIINTSKTPSTSQLTPLKHTHSKPRSSPTGSRTSTPSTSQRRGTGGPRPSLPTAESIAMPPLPHYTVIRSNNNSNNSPHVIRIHERVTDGDTNRWPTNTTEGDVVEGRLNWYDAIPLNKGTNLRWRIQVAQELAQRLGLETPRAGGKSDHWILEDWPQHYKFFIHRTKTNSTGLERTDPYLFGSKLTHKFRSVNETIPHIEWLLQHGPDDDLRCECKYCSKKTQAEVNAAIGLTNKREGSTPSIKSFNKSPITRIRNELPSSRNVDKMRHGPPLRSESPLIRVQHEDTNQQQSPTPAVVVKARNPTVDLPSYRGAYTNKQRDFDLGDKVLYRQGELVWAKLNKPLQDKRTSLNLSYWPGLIADRNVSIKSNLIQPLKSNELPQFSIVQQFKYTIKLLGVDDELNLVESEILPWLSHTPLTELVLNPNWTTRKSSVELIWDGEKTLRPKLNQMKTIGKAVTTYALSIQIARSLIQDFGLNDRYLITKDHFLQQVPGPLTKQDSERQEIQLKHWHYQSLWWGAEKIWSGELVRLMIDDIQDLTNEVKQNKQIDQSLKPKNCYFLKLSSIFKDSNKDVAMLGGTLYELRLKQQQDQEGDDDDQDKTQKPLYMPDAPPGYEFVESLSIGQTVLVDCDLLAGRYYPLPIELFQTTSTTATTTNNDNQIESIFDINKYKQTIQSLKNYFNNVSLNSQQQDIVELTDHERAICLAGLVPASLVYMPCVKFSKGRQDMVISAEIKARDLMKSFLSQTFDKSTMNDNTVDEA
ncbi:hypothetical protein OIO90_004019 [Microbotryomycetes sp. JL221]|nr:hypothetical protein OIO90_004019 [Microbotryomycetes sp. JL221]